MLGALCAAPHPAARSASSSESGEDVRGPLVSDEERITSREVRRTQPWAITVGYRFQPSSRHFIGTIEQKQREALNNQIQNTYHLLDIAVERQLTRRFSATASLPLVFAWRNQRYAPRGEYRVRGIGDMTIGARGWLFRPPTESGGNVAIGLSLKLPTGKYDSTGSATDSQGNPVIATADQSIQAGDGGVGLAVDMQAYRPAWFSTMVYLTGSYLLNPRDTNGVRTFRTRRGEEIMSVSDQYLARGGVARATQSVRTRRHVWWTV